MYRNLSLTTGGVWLVGLILTFLTACNQQMISQQDEASISVPANDSELDATQAEENNPSETASESGDDQESANMPQVVSGAYLSCDRSFNSEDRDIDHYVIQCGLRDQQSNILLEKGQRSEAEIWQVLGLPASLLQKLAIQVDPSNNFWQAVFLFSDLGPAEVSQIKEQAIIDLQLNNGQNFQSNSQDPSFSLGVQWQHLDGDTPPDHTLVAGSEISGTVDLHLCRIYVNGHLLPGKLLDEADFSDTGGSCFSVSNGNSVLATFDSNLPFDGLVVPNGGNRPDTSLTNLTWVAVGDDPAQPLPPSMYPSGYLADGRLLYSCRALQAGPAPAGEQGANDDDGEMTPGYLIAGERICRYEYFGEKLADKFEILTIKQ